MRNCDRPGDAAPAAVLPQRGQVLHVRPGPVVDNVAIILRVVRPLVPRIVEGPRGGTQRDRWPCRDPENADLIRMLKLYAPMLPQEKDSVGALDFYTNGEDPNGEPHPEAIFMIIFGPLFGLCWFTFWGPFSKWPPLRLKQALANLN